MYANALAMPSEAVDEVGWHCDGVEGRGRKESKDLATGDKETLCSTLIATRDSEIGAQTV
jgi:hypothetical protein